MKAPGQGWRDWTWRFVLHVATGLLAVGAHYGVMALALWLGLGAVGASGVGFVAGALTRFYTAYAHVYATTTRAVRVAPRFVLALAVQFVANAALLDALLAAGLAVWWAQVTTTVILAFATYLAYRLLVFR
jgi:GtrA-like protein